MDFLGIESQKKKEMAEIMDNGSNSERVEEGKAKSHATETKYNNKITGSNNDVIMIDKNKNSVSSDDLGLFSNYSCEKGSLSTELRLGMAFEKHCDKKKSLPSCIRSVNGGAKRVVGAFIPQLDLSSVGSCSDSINLLHNQSGFGSPIEVMGRFEHKTSSDDDKGGCSGFMSSFRPAASMIPGKQSRAQLTIFYGGSVNLYDDIPADKAQAIMLIASSGKYSSYEHTNVQNGCGSQTEQKIAFPGMKLLEESEIQPQPAIRKVNTGRMQTQSVHTRQPKQTILRLNKIHHHLQHGCTPILLLNLVMGHENPSDIFPYSNLLRNLIYLNPTVYSGYSYLSIAFLLRWPVTS